MARCFQSAQEFILGAFPVMVGALVSDDAEAICQKNDLTFVELVRPFCQLSSEAHIRDPVNPSIVVPVKNWKMRIVDIQAPLPPPVLVKRVLTDVVSKSLLSVDLKSKAAVDKQIDIPTPWYDAYKDCFFQLIEPMEHEFIRHYLACILVVSTKHPDPMNAFAALSSRQNSLQQASAQSSSPQFRWFSTNTFKYYLLLHDVSDGEDAKADAVYQSMKSVYGSHTCFLLQLNSRLKMFHQTAEQKLNFSDLWTQHMYPFTDETFDIDESELEKAPKVTNVHEASQRDADKSEEAIVSVLESIDKSIQETQSGPRAMSFNDPLTSMQYKESLADDDSDIIEDSLGVYKYGDPRDRKPSPRPRKLSERSQRLHEYKKSLRQFSYNMVGGAVQNNRKERGFCLTLMDQDKIRACLYEFAIRGLLPHIEKLMRMISEQILARRGLHKSIFNATKKWFGGNKSTGGSLGTGFNAGNSYTMDSPELHHRRLGDLAFLVQHFDLAYNSYHSAKREFNNDHAWVYFAGALEMAAISAFMLGNNRVYPVHYFEACISTYMNTCRLPEYATRACLMSTEALKSRDMYPESASEFIKLTHEDADLRSALFLEQAAHCYLHNKPPMFRKYAFHMILAGHRFSKSLQRKHTLRCYINALQVYQNKSWYLAEDHVNFTIGRQSFNLGNLEDAQLALKSLLVYESLQPAAQQASHMREFLAVFKQYLSSKTSQSDADFLPNLPLPHIDCSATKVLLSVSSDALENNVTPTPSTPASRRTRTVCAGSYTFQKAYSKSYMLRWAELEKQVLLAVKGEVPYPFKPFVPCLSASTDNSRSSTLSVEETFAVELNFFNPLMITLNLLELTLLWEFSPAAQDVIDASITNRVQQHHGYVTVDVIANLPVKASEKRSAAFKISVLKPGTLKIIGVKYVLSSASVTSSSEEGNLELSVHQEAALRAVGVLGMQEIFIRGPRLNSTKQERATTVYGIDKRLEPLIIPALPELKVTMLDLPMTMLCGEIQQVMFTFQNVGKLSLKNLYVVTNFPECFSLADAGESFSCSKNNRSTRADPCVPVNFSTAFARKRVFQGIVDYSRCSEKISKVRISLDNGVLPPGAEVNVPFFIYGLDNSGVHEIYFLFYYEPVEEVRNVSYRIVQRMVRVQTLSTLNLMSASRPSERHDGDCREHAATYRQQQVREDSESTAEGCPEKQDLENTGDCTSLASRSLEDRVLSLVVENKSKGSMNLRCVEFTLKQLICYSSKWKVHTLINYPQDSYRLRPDEAFTLHLKMTRQEKLPGGLAYTSAINLADSTIEACSSSSFELFLKSPSSFEALENSVGLVLLWETFFIDESFTRIVIKGQNHMSLSRGSLQTTEHLAPQHSEMSAAVSPVDVSYVNRTLPSVHSPSNVLYVTYQYPPLVTNDFERRRLCYATIGLLCFNSSDEDAELEINTHDVAEEKENQAELLTMPRVQSTDLMQWVGCRHTNITVRANSHELTSLRCLFSSAGLYEIQNITVLVLTRHSDGRVEKEIVDLPQSHFICIKNEGAPVISRSA